MNFNRIQTVQFVVCIALATLSVWHYGSFAQEPSPAVDDIRDFGETFVVIQSIDQFREHAPALVTDLGYGVFSDSARDLFSYETEGEYDSRRPIIIYSDGNFRREVTQLPVKSLDLVKKRAGSDVQDVSRIFATQDVGFRESFYGVNPLYAIVDKSKLSFSKDRKWLEEFGKSDPIKKLLNIRFQKLINQSGLTFFFKVTEDYHPMLALSSEKSKRPYTEKELETLRLIDQVIESANHTAVGFTYNNKCVALRGLIGFKDHEAAKKVLDFDAAKRPFQPTIGLSKKNLISSASIQIDVLKSPETARLIPKYLHDESWLFGDSKKWLSGESVEIAIQLLADTWHDARGVRVGLYECDGGLQGRLCVVGVVDPKNPDTVIDELQKLVTLVDSNDDDESKTNRANEINNLIKQLGSPDYNVRQRATTRLMLAGREAEKLLLAAARSDNAEIRVRAQRVIRKLRNQAEKSMQKLLVSSTEFWSNLRPRFSMARNQVKYGSHDCHLLRIHPDPDKTEQQVRDASEIMKGIFGQSWDQLPMVRVGDRYVFMFGSNTELLDEVVANVKANRDPIGSSELIQKQNMAPGQFQIQVSIPRFLNVYFGQELSKKIEVTDNNLTTLNLSLDPETWGADLHMPVEELKTIIDYQFGKYRASDDF